MSRQTKRGGLRNPKGGRPALSPGLKRVRCGWLTIPAWLADWLKEQPEAAGHIVETALVEKHHLNPPQT